MCMMIMMINFLALDLRVSVLIDRESSGSVESVHSSRVPESVTDEVSLPRDLTSVSVCFVILCYAE